MTSDKEKEILWELKSGNLLAFEKILYVYEDRILNYIYRFVQRREDAEDLTQETFIRFYTNIKSVDPDNNFKGWLYKIATNVVIDWLRKEKRLKAKWIKTVTDGAEYQYLQGASEAGGYEMNIVKKIEDVDEVKRAMRNLHPMHQSILILFYWDGFSQPEIAELWGIPLGSVKTRLRHARQELKEVLLEDNGRSENLKKEYGLSLRKI